MEMFFLIEIFYEYYIYKFFFPFYIINNFTTSNTNNFNTLDISRAEKYAFKILLLFSFATFNIRNVREWKLKTNEIIVFVKRQHCLVNYRL